MKTINYNFLIANKACDSFESAFYNIFHNYDIKINRTNLRLLKTECLRFKKSMEHLKYLAAYIFSSKVTINKAFYYS